VRRIPHGPGLLFDHSAAPVPRIGPHGLVPDLRGSVPIMSLGRRVRRDMAVQLTAYAAAAAEVDLWPVAWALRGARAIRTRHGPRAVAAAFPVQMAPLLRRLGGGEGAAAAVRSGVEAAIHHATGIKIRGGAGDLGFYLDGHLRRQLADVGEVWEHWTERALWAYRWPVPDLPTEAAEHRFVGVASSEAARRLAAGAWAHCPARGIDARLVEVEPRRFEGPDPPPADLVIATGVFAVEDLQAMEAWGVKHGVGMLCFGRFPPGWNPPGPKRAASGTGQGMVVVGPSAEEARREIQLRGDLSFDPTNDADGEALSRACSRRASGEHSSTFRRVSADGAALELVAGLLPEGVPEAFLIEHSGASMHEVVRAVGEGLLVSDGERWRLAQPRLLEKNPLHARVADLFERWDPRRLLHGALGGEPVDGLLEWLDEALRDLRSSAVLELLAPLYPGALGAEVTERVVEAHLADLEPGGARRLLGQLRPERAWVFERWLDGVDAGAEGIELPHATDEALKIHPRAAAEIAAAAARRVDGRSQALAVLEQALDRLSGAVAAWFEVERVSRCDSERLTEGAWRRRVAQGHPVVRCRMLHRRAQSLASHQRARSARRAHRFLLARASTPGRRGMLELDLAAASSDDPSSEGTLLLQALRHLEAAGFERRTDRILFNLGMMDLEHWRLDRAEARLHRASGGDDAVGDAALAQLALARGRLDEVRDRIDRVSLRGVPDHLASEWRQFEGMVELFEGRPDAADRILATAGDEAVVWRRVVEARRTGRFDPPVSDDSVWPVARIGRLVAAVAAGDLQAVRAGSGAGSLEEALAAVVAARISGAEGRALVENGGATAALLEREGLHGWALWAAPRTAVGDDTVAALLARLVEGEDVRDLSDEQWLELLAGVGATGIECRLAHGEQILWAVGSGNPGRSRSIAGRRLTLLGGEPPESGRWRLLAAVIARRLPDPRPACDADVPTTGIVGRCPSIVDTNHAIGRLAPTPVEVLVTGETGTGKELVARALHRLSGRAGRFVAVNVAEISGSLFEAELFGAVRGAFTGADRDRAGLIEAADGGTLFLDEIGELELPFQVKLLRFLDLGEIRAVGADRTRTVDVRVVMATHRNLQSMVDAGTFRLDLHHRIKGTEVRLPPLRERGDDIVLLRDLFLERSVSEQGLRRARWSVDADRALLNHSWPGNVRELRRVVETALVHAQGGRVTAADLPFGTRDATPLSSARWDQAHADLRRRLIVSALESAGGNRSGAARQLGLTRQTLLYHMRKLGIR
jgi:DNA-binding NtrC family response regulator